MKSDWWYLLALQNYALVILGLFVWKGFLFSQPLLSATLISITPYLSKRLRGKNEMQ